MENYLSSFPSQMKKVVMPASVLVEAKHRVLDSLGCFYGAQDSKPIQLLHKTLTKEIQGPVSLWGTKKHVSPELAAWVNGAAVRALDFNDTYLSKEPCHPSDLMASVWAACELSGKNNQGSLMLHGMILGYEVLCRLCDAASLRKRGWDHVTYLPIASAVGCAYVLGLSQEQTRHAIALACVGHTALRQTRVGTISDWKASCAAYAAQAGLWAARLAKNGFTGPFDIFGGKHGFQNQVSGFLPLSTKTLGKEWMILKTHVKYFPAEHHSQSAIEGALLLRTQLKKKKIKKILIETFDVGVDIIGKEKEKWKPSTRETADHSLPYLVAVALLDGKVSLNQFKRRRFLDADVRGLMQKISIKPAAWANKMYPKHLPIRIQVRTKDKTTVHVMVTLPRGYAGRGLTKQEFVQKFEGMAKRYLNTSQMQKVESHIFQLEKVKKLQTISKLLVT